MDDRGSIKNGPEKLKNHEKNQTVSSEMKPRGSGYDYDPEDTLQEFSHKNVKKLMPIHEESGMEGIEDEWYKVRLENCTGDFHELTSDGIDEVFDENFDRRDRNGFRMWLVEYDHEIKPRVVMSLTKNKAVHNAALNVLYENYKDKCKEDKTEPLPYEKFLTTPLKMYRGGSGKEYEEAAAFSSYTLNKGAAEKFKNGPTGHETPKEGVVYEADIRPIDTYGSLNTSGEMEIFVPRMIAPNGRKDEDDVREDGYDIYRHVREVFEDYGVERDELIKETLDEIISEARLFKVFEGKNDDSSEESRERCVDGIQKGIARLMTVYGEYNEDSAFFSGELDKKIGERNVLYPEVNEYRERRQKRKDAKDDGRWVTTEEKHKIHINEEGLPDKGNPHVIKVMKGEGPNPKTREELGKARVERIRSKVKSGFDRYKEANEKVKTLAEEYKDVGFRYERSKRQIEAIKRYKDILKRDGINEGDGGKLKREHARLVEKAARMRDKYEKEYGKIGPFDTSEEANKLRDVEGRKNKLGFTISMYDDCFDEESKQVQRDFPRLEEERNKKKAELDKCVSERKAAREEIRKGSERNAQSMKFYNEDERKKIKEDFLSGDGVSEMSDYDKRQIAKSIEGASDAQLSVLQKTMKNARIRKMEEDETGVSHYTSTTGRISLEEEDMSDPKIFWHEYGHYMDDFEHSGMEYDVVTYGEGTAYESHTNTFTDVLENDVKIFGKDGEEDFKELFSDVKGLNIRTNDSENFLWVADDNGVEAKDTFELQKAWHKKESEFINGGENGGKLTEYYNSIGYPLESERPDREDYIETYVTPKRKLEREREKYKGAGEEYLKKLKEYYDKREEVEKANPDFSEKVTEIFRERERKERLLAPVSDCICGALGGKVFSIYGCHERDYYRINGGAIKEWTANIHQMMFMGQKEPLDFLSELMPRTMKKVKAAYNEYLWRNMV